MLKDMAIFYWTIALKEQSMIFKQQAEFGFPNLMNVKVPRMDFSQRAAMKWATIEERDRVLDMDCGNGALLHMLTQQYRVDACGLCPGARQARSIRDLLPEVDVMNAQPGDIPFRSASFDAVLITRRTGKNCQQNALGEILRVLRPGGQVVIACKGMKALRNLIMDGDMEMDKRELMRALQQAGFREVSWRSAGLLGIVIAWKPNNLK